MTAITARTVISGAFIGGTVGFILGELSRANACSSAADIITSGSLSYETAYSSCLNHTSSLSVRGGLFLIGASIGVITCVILVNLAARIDIVVRVDNRGVGGKLRVR
jgi:hypothetical protein